MKTIILASSSPRRKEILEKTGLQFKIVPSDYQENLNLKLPPLELAKKLSRGKAEWVAKKYKNHLVIGADTFVDLGNKLLGKPKNPAQAKKMLRQVSGKTLSVITGFTIIDTQKNKSLSWASETKVYLNKLTDTEINNYIKTNEPLDMAGAFGIQGLGAVFVKKIQGDFFNVMGLPLYDLNQALKKFGIKVL